MKLVDPAGLTLAETWEPHASLVANCSDSELVNTLQRVVDEEAINLKQKEQKAMLVILIGYDTR